MREPPVIPYRGRLAPSPTGFLHLGHARTFWAAWHRTRIAQGKLVFRNEDLDFQRCKPEFVQAMYQDLRWLGLDWDEGPDVGGPYAPYSQSERRNFYLDAWRKLRDSGLIYPCTCSRKDLELALSAPHEEPLHGATNKITSNRGPQAGGPHHARFSRDGAEAPSPAHDNVEQAKASPASLQQQKTYGTAAPAGGPAIDDELPYPGTCRGKIATAKDYDSPTA